MLTGFLLAAASVLSVAAVDICNPDAGKLQPSSDNPRKQALPDGFSLNDDGWEGSQWLSVREAPVSDYPSGVNDSKTCQRAADGTSWFVADLGNGKRVKRAVWTTTALGVYDITVNGKPVGEDFLKPGYTHVKRTRQSFAYDVTDLMRRGADESNRFAAEVSAGWWRDKIVNFVGKKSAFRGILEVEYDDGTTRRFGTNAQDWKVGIAGPVLHAGIFDGEIFDARQKPDVAKFGEPEINVEFGGVIRPCEGAKVTLRRDLAVRRGPFALKKGEKLVVDFGQNMAAVPEFVFRAKRGRGSSVCRGK